MHDYAPPPPAEPTKSLTIDGIELAPAERLVALAAIRDQKRVASRGHYDVAQSHVEQIQSHREIIRRISANAAQGHRGMLNETAAEIARLEAEIAQLRSAEQAARAASDAARDEFGAAQRLLVAACELVVAHGGILPHQLAVEANARATQRLAPGAFEPQAIR